MTVYQEILLAEFFAVIALCGAKGGPPERSAAAWVLLSAIVEGAVLPPLAIDGFMPLEAAVDAVVTVMFIRLSLTGPRWWPFAAAGSMLLAMMLHAYVLLVGGISMSTQISAQIGLSALLYLTLAAGVLERSLAGEAAVSPHARWKVRHEPADNQILRSRRCRQV
ncbi:MAG: hypothetical protein H2038_02675 [Brevundimonas sp.]|uniref:hypothetical protein n=1 Tax=Brevundimonas sp. TaxID=1871086 RepID=UPI0017C7396B|nr:hypothetical protein [Brevundimonas sp.]MBA4803539.1 hypothetical protein [Brevundimonas sp.]